MEEGALTEMLREGYVRWQQHPEDPLLYILNYTHAAQYGRVWNDVTRQCRGLIVRGERGGALISTKIVSRPWPKFYNYGEHPEGTLDLHAPARVADKLDGSLGILYPRGEGWAIATRGSFTSDQAHAGTAMLEEQLRRGFHPRPGLTYLYEIIFPANRIVVDYGDAEKLVLLDVLDTETGEQVLGDPWSEWLAAGGEWVNWGLGAGTLAQALALPPRPNAEGVVVRIEGGPMVKIKQDDYVELHRLVTGLNERVVWERLGRGETVAEICEPLPDEFRDWVAGVADDLQEKAAEIYTEAWGAYRDTIESVSEGGERRWERKEFALFAQTHYPELASYIFSFLDEKDVRPAIWRTLKPRGDAAPRAFTEDVA